MMSLDTEANTASESTVLNSDLSNFFGPRQVPGRELRELISAEYLCVSVNSWFFRGIKSPTLVQNSANLYSDKVLSKQCSARYL